MQEIDIADLAGSFNEGGGGNFGRVPGEGLPKFPAFVGGVRGVVGTYHPGSCAFWVLVLDICWENGPMNIEGKEGTRYLAMCLMPSPHTAVPPPFDLISLQRGMTSRACSGLSRKWTKKSPSLCQLSKAGRESVVDLETARAEFFVILKRCLGQQRASFLLTP